MRRKIIRLAIIGPTACGKTALAVRLAQRLNADIISADSRQVFRGMDIGTGKDLTEYANVPYHLIDIRNPGDPFNVSDFVTAARKIIKRSQHHIICGGTGLYIEALLRGYDFAGAPPNQALRAELSALTNQQLKERLLTYGDPPPGLDLCNPHRVMRAIESRLKPTPATNRKLAVHALVFGLHLAREERWRRIELRLDARLQQGLVEEVKTLLNNGIPPQTLISYGLEYKYITQLCLGELTLTDCRDKLLTAIRQFSKRQMTWWRGMEKRGTYIHWISAHDTLDEQVETAVNLVRLNGGKDLI